MEKVPLPTAAPLAPTRLARPATTTLPPTKAAAALEATSIGLISCQRRQNIDGESP